MMDAANMTVEMRTKATLALRLGWPVMMFILKCAVCFLWMSPERAVSILERFYWSQARFGIVDPRTGLCEWRRFSD